MAITIGSSVGEGGANKPADVGKVQTLLNNVRAAKIVVDQRCGPATIQAIREFQKGFLPVPDGRVDPGGRTWKKLLQEPPLVLLPQLGGLGYYPYSPMARQYGTVGAIETLKDVGRSCFLNLPTLPFGIGDISLEHGGPMPPHQTHQNGRQADIRPLRTDGLPAPVSITDSTYSRERTQLLVKSFLAHRNVHRILFNDTAIKGVHFFPGHHNHLHVETNS